MSKLNKLSCSIQILESILSRSNTNFNLYLSEKLNNLSELIISMTETIFARRPTCAEIISNIGKYTLGIAELKAHPELENMTKNLLENVPENSIFCDYLDQVLSVLEEIVPTPVPRTIIPQPNIIPNYQGEVLSNDVRNIIEQDEMDGIQPNQNGPVWVPQPEIENEAKETVNKVSRELGRIGKQTRNFFKKF